MNSVLEWLFTIQATVVIILALAILVIWDYTLTSKKKEERSEQQEDSLNPFENLTENR